MHQRAVWGVSREVLSLGVGMSRETFERTGHQNFDEVSVRRVM